MVGRCQQRLSQKPKFVVIFLGAFPNRMITGLQKGTTTVALLELRNSLNMEAS